MVKNFAFLCALLCCGVLLGKTMPSIQVEVDSTRAFPNSIAIAKARTELLESLRATAIEKALPREVSLSSLTTDMYVAGNAKLEEQTARSIFMMSSMAGRIVQEKILVDEPILHKNSALFDYRIKYRAEVLPVKNDALAQLDMELWISNNLLKDGEEFEISISPPQDGYLYIFNFLPDQSVALVLPTMSNPEHSLKAHQKWQQKLRAMVAPNYEHSIETLYFVFSTAPIKGWEHFRRNENAKELVFSAGQESYTLFQKWLSKSDPNQRAEKMVQIHIFK